MFDTQNLFTKNVKNIIIVGFGQSTIGFLLQLDKHNMLSEFNISIIEKSSNVYESFSGLRYDGKLFISKTNGSIHPKVLSNIGIQEAFINFLNLFFKQNFNCDIPLTDVSNEKFEYYKQLFEKYNFQLSENKYYHIGTDQLQKIMYDIYEYFKNKGVKFIFNERIVDILEKKSKFVAVSKNNKKYSGDLFVVQVGRSGYSLILNLKEKFADIVNSNTEFNVDIGVRFELPSHIVESINKDLYEFKVSYKTHNGLSVRTFCNNPNGFVVTEKYENFALVNGHSKQNEKSSNTNFAILVSIPSKYLTNPTMYLVNIQENIKANIGGKKVILQRLKDFLDGTTTEEIGDVIPTLSPSEYKLGNINLFLPHIVSDQIKEFLVQLNKVIPGITNNDNLLYQLEAKFYTNLLSNKENILFIGDCSGWTRSIVHAQTHGYITALNKIVFK